MRILRLALGILATAAGAAPGGSLASGVAHAPRPLNVEGASTAILRATVSGPHFYAPETFPGIEDYHNPRLKRLRDEYGLAQVIAGETGEFRKQLRLRHWVFSRWPIDNDQQFGGDAFSILEKAKTGAGFHCSHSLAVQHAVMVSMGFVVRDLGVDRNHEDLGRSVHHGVNEVWSNEYAKWVLFDAKYDIHFERAGVPLSALELHEAVRADGGRGIVKAQGIERREAPMDVPEAPEATVRGYWWVSYYLRPSPFTEPNWSGSSRLLVFDSPSFRESTWHRGSSTGLVEHWAYAANAFVRTLNRHEIEWTPGVTDLRLRQLAPAELEVELRSATPNLAGYMVSINGKGWRAAESSRLRWPLSPGENQLEVRTRNRFGVEGPIASAAVRFAP
jgi:hypothetical protein